MKVHAYIIHYLKKQMPYVIGKSEKQKKLLDRLDREFLACARRYNLPLGDFPPVEQYRKMLREIKDISDFKKLDKNLVYEMDRVLTHDIPLLLQKATMKVRKGEREGVSDISITLKSMTHCFIKPSCFPTSLYLDQFIVCTNRVEEVKEVTPPTAIPISGHQIAATKPWCLADKG